MLRILYVKHLKKRKAEKIVDQTFCELEDSPLYLGQ